MKRKLVAILVLFTFCISSFAFAGEEDFPVILKVVESKSCVFDDVNEEK